MKLMNATLRRLWHLTKATSIVVGLAVMVGLVAGVASTPLGANTDNFILGSVNNTATAITKLTGTVSGGPALQVSNPSTATGSTALDLQVATGKAPMKVNRTTKVANLNSDQVDGKSAENLSRVAVMNTSAATLVPADNSLEVTYGTPLSITAPAAGFVRLNGNVTVLNEEVNKCTSGCQFVANVRHINTNRYGNPAIEDALSTYGNAGLDAVFPVNAGVNTFDIRLSRESNGEAGKLYGYWGTLTAEYTPYGSTGTGTL